MAYVTQQPNTNTNPTDKYRVVWMDDWLRYVNGATHLLPIAGTFDTYDEANARKDALNG